MEIPTMSFLASVQYSDDPHTARVTWVGIDSGNVIEVLYEDVEEIRRINLIVIQQHTAPLTEGLKERINYLRALCHNRPN